MAADSVGLPKYFGGGPFNLLNKIFFMKSYIESGDVDMGAVKLCSLTPMMS